MHLFFYASYTKIIFTLLTEIIVLFVNLIIVYVYESSLQKPLIESLKKVKEVAGVLVSRKIMKMYCKTFFKNLTIENIAKHIV